MSRSYTADEVDRMRSSIRYIRDMGTTRSVEVIGFVVPMTMRSREQIEALNIPIEEQLRTYIFAGVDPEELE